MTLRGLGARIFAVFQYILPHHLLSRCVYRLMRVRARPVKNSTIRLFSRAFGVDWSEAVSDNPDDYETFNAFFTRELKAGLRPVAEAGNAVACPVDGRMSRLGEVRAGELLQAKDRVFSVANLLGGDPELSARFETGSFCTIYLAPYNYHRIHMPLSGVLREMIYVPGRLFSVNAATVANVPDLFARNERIVNVFDTEFGAMCVVMVGAMNVGSMATVWAGDVTPAAKRTPQRWTFAGGTDSEIRLDKGDELGRFNMGSTVILLFENGAVTWSDDLEAGAAVRMGADIGRMSATTSPTGT